MRTQPDAYPAALKILHWATAVIIMLLIPAGVLMHQLPPGPAQDQLYFLHKSFGVLVLALTLGRIVVRLSLGAPPPAPTLTPVERAASRTVHRLLYALLIFMPVVGWLAVSAYGAPIDFFGLFQLPPLMGKDEAAAKPLFRAHMIGAVVLVCALALHIGGALAHLWRRDGVFQRMARRR